MFAPHGNYDGSGDRELASFGNQLWVTKLAWSPDDTELAFDIAPRLVVNGLELQMGDPAQSEIYAFRFSDQAFRLVAPIPAAFPTWSILDSSVQPAAPKMRFSAHTPLELEISNVVAGQQLDLETSSNLAQWTAVRSFSVSGDLQKIPIPEAQARFQFWRVRVR